METNNYYVKKRRAKTASRIFWGLFFLLAGVAIFLNQLGLFSFMDLSLGNIILSALLLAIFIKSCAHGFWFGIFFSLFGLVYIYSSLLGIPSDLSWWPIIAAALLLSIGFSILFRPKKKDWYIFGSYDYDPQSCNREDTNNRKTVYAETIDDNESINSNGNATSNESFSNENASNSNEETTYTSSGSEDESEVFVRASFGSTIKYVNSKNLKRASINCNFGAVKAYFDNAFIPSGEAEINIEASFCGIELFVPSGWQIMDEMDHVLGGVEEKNPQRANGDGPRIHLTGHMKLSGIEIIYV